MKSDIIQAIIDQQLTGAEIARRFSVSRQYVGQIAEQIGIKPYRKEPKPPYQRKQKDIDPLQKQRAKYRDHKRRAETRGIEFLLTFEEWWAMWEPHYSKMGRGKGKMCMCRNLDKGPYSVGNVRIDYVESNGHDKVSARISNKGTKWMCSQTKKGGERHLPNDLMICQDNDVEEDPFVYYAELVTSHVHIKRD